MQNRFARTALAVIAFSFLFFSCKKNKDPEYFFKVKIEGDWVSFKNALGELGPDLGDPAKTNFTAGGYSEDMKTSFDISFQVDGSTIGTGTYEYSQVYMPVNYMIDFGGPNFKSYADSWLDPNPEPHFTITITSIDDKVIRGTFTGNYLVEDFTDEVIDVTEGEFAVRRIR